MTKVELDKILPAAKKIDAIYPYTDPIKGESTMLILSNGLERELPSVSLTLVATVYAQREDKDYKALTKAYRQKPLARLSPSIPISLELMLTPLKYRKVNIPHQMGFAFINTSHRFELLAENRRSPATIRFSSSAELKLITSYSAAYNRLSEARAMYFSRLFNVESRLLAAKKEFVQNKNYLL